jgi:hypothetical protein
MGKFVMTSNEIYRPIKKCKRCRKPESMSSKLLKQDYKMFTFLHPKGNYCPLCAERNIKEIINFQIAYKRLTGRELKEGIPDFLKEIKNAKK